MAHGVELTSPSEASRTDKPEAVAEVRWRYSSAVAVTAAILAALASVSALLSGHHTDAAMLDQIQEANQWAYYQSKGIKLAVLESKLELLPALGKAVEPADTDRAARYRQEQETIAKDAGARSASVEMHRKLHKTASFAATCFQVAIALAAVALLVRRNPIWIVSICTGIAGFVLLIVSLAGGL